MAPSDPFFGFRELAELSEHVITSLFSVSPSTSTAGVGRPGIDTPPQSPPIEPTKESSPPPLGEFIAYALYRTRLPVSITHQALLLLSRLKTRYPSARGTATSPHRLFLSSLMLSSKISMDDTYSNKSWQVVGQGIFTLREVNQMERELFAFLGWNVVVRDEELAAFVHDVVDVYELEKSLAANAAPFSTFAPVAPVAAATPSSSASPVASTSAPAARSEKRRRSTSRDSTASSSSRSPSPGDRHRRASDAALALLQGSDMPSTSASPSRRSRTRTPECRSSPYSTSRPASCYSSSSSTVASPHFDVCSTPSSPSTPVSAGPMTPDHVDESLAPAWARSAYSKPSKGQNHHDYASADRIQVEVASW